MFDSPRGRRNIFSLLAQASSPSLWQCIWLAGSMDNTEFFGPVGAGLSAIAPLKERLPELIEGSLRSQSSFEYVRVLAVNSL